MIKQTGFHVSLRFSFDFFLHVGLAGVILHYHFYQGLPVWVPMKTIRAWWIDTRKRNNLWHPKLVLVQGMLLFSLTGTPGIPKFPLVLVRIFNFHKLTVWQLFSIPSMGRTVYFPTWMAITINRIHVGKYMGVSKNRGTPKWMIYNGKPY